MQIARPVPAGAQYNALKRTAYPSIRVGSPLGTRAIAYVVLPPDKAGLLMRPQGLASPCAFGGGGPTFPLNSGAVSAPRQEFMHPRQHSITVDMRGASTSGNRRVRPCPPRRTVLLPECEGATGASASRFDTRLASAVMAGDENMEQLSRMKQRGPALGKGNSSRRRRSSGSLGEQEGRRQEGQGRWQENAQRNRGRGRSSIDAAVGAALTATPKMQVRCRPAVHTYVGRPVALWDATSVSPPGRTRSRA